MTTQSIALRVFIVIALAIVSSTTSALAQPYVDYGFINEYLNGRVLGKYTAPNSRPVAFTGYPGPCRTARPQDVCRIDFSKTPEGIKSINVDLGIPTLHNVSVGGLSSGTAQLSYLEIKNVEIGSIVITNSIKNATHVSLNLQVKGVKFDATTDFRIANVQIMGSSAAARGTALLKKSEQTHGGTDINMTLIFHSPNLLTKQIPTQLLIPAEAPSCHVKFDLGFNIANVANRNVYDQFVVEYSVIAGSAFAQQVNAVYSLIEPVLSYFTCDLISQLGVLNNGQPGLIGVYLDYLASNVTKWTNAPNPNVVAADTAAHNALSPAKKAKVMDFQDSVVMALLSKAVNDWLAAPSIHNIYNLVINDVVNTLTPDEPGTFKAEELTAAGAIFGFDAQAVHAKIEVKNFEVNGANTFKTLELLENNYGEGTVAADRMHYTLNHNVSIADMRIVLGIKLDLADGAWESTPGANPVKTAEFTLDISVQNFMLAASTLTAIAPGELKNRQLGQLLGGTKTTFSEQVLYSSQCQAPALYDLAISNLEVSIGSLNPVPALVNFPDAAIADLVNSAIDIIVTAIKAAITINLPKVMQQFVRPFVNKFIKNHVIGKATTCVPFVPPPNTPKFFNFLTSNIFKGASKAVNEVLGGDPVVIRDSSINKISGIFLKGFADFFHFTYSYNEPQHKWLFHPNFKFQLGDGSDSDVNSETRIGDIEMQNIDSVYRLTLDPVSADEFSFRFGIGDGILKDPYAIPPNDMVQRGDLIIKQTLGVSVTYPLGSGIPQVVEDFAVVITISKLEVDLDAQLKLDLNKLFKLKLTSLSRPSCLLAAFDEGQLDLAVDVNKVTVNIVRHISNPGTRLANALTAFADELDNSEEGVLEAMLNTIVASAIGLVTNTVNDFAGSNTTVDNCPTITPAFSGVLAHALTELIFANLTELAELYSGPQPAPPSFAEIDAGVNLPEGASTFHWDENSLGNLPQSFVNQATNERFKDFLRSVGEGESTYVQRSIVEEVDESISLKADLSSIVIPLDGFIDTASITLSYLNITNIDKVDMGTMKLLDPKSHFVTQTSFSIPGTMHLSFSVKIDVPGGFLNNPSPRLVQTVALEVEFVDLVLDLWLAIALNLDLMSYLGVGHFVSIDSDHQFSPNMDIVDCLFSLFYDFSIPKLVMDVDDLTMLQISSTNNNIMSAASIDLINAVLEIVADMAESHIPDLTQGALRVFINKMVLEPSLDQPGSCQEHILPSSRYAYPQEALNISNIELLKNLNYFIEDEFLNQDSLWYINSILQELGDFTIPLPDPYVIPIQSSGIPDGLFRVHSVKFKSVSGIDGLAILDTRPYEPGGSEYPTRRRRNLAEREWTVEDMDYMSRNHLTHNRPGHLVLDIQLEGDFHTTPDSVESDKVHLDLSLSGVDLLADFYMLVNVSKLMDYSFNWTTSCLLTAFIPDGLIPAKFDVQYSVEESLVTCATMEGCATPPLLMLNSATSPEVDAAFTNAFNAKVASSKQWMMSEEAETSIRNRTANSQEDCIDGHAPSPSGSTTSMPTTAVPTATPATLAPTTAVPTTGAPTTTVYPYTPPKTECNMIKDPTLCSNTANAACGECTFLSSKVSYSFRATITFIMEGDRRFIDFDNPNSSPKKTQFVDAIRQLLKDNLPGANNIAVYRVGTINQNSGAKNGYATYEVSFTDSESNRTAAKQYLSSKPDTFNFVDPLNQILNKKMKTSGVTYMTGSILLSNAGIVDVGNGKGLCECSKDQSQSSGLSRFSIGQMCWTWLVMAITIAAYHG